MGTVSHLILGPSMTQLVSDYTESAGLVKLYQGDSITYWHNHINEPSAALAGISSESKSSVRLKPLAAYSE